MEAESIIQQADQAGIEISLDGNKIAVKPISKLSADLRELIRVHREEVVQYLSCKTTPAELIRLAIQSGVFDQGILLDEKEIAALLPPTDWRDVTNCSTDEFKAWAAALAMRAVRYRGQVPAGWSKVAHCEECGPVYSFHDQDTLSCGWCEMTRAGKPFSKPRENETK
ncbi:hypothetical protein ACFL1V_03125 [Pseudomonadota bacterium]